MLFVFSFFFSSKTSFASKYFFQDFLCVQEPLSFWFVVFFFMEILGGSWFDKSSGVEEVFTGRQENVFMA